jgi:hypothetical protein
LLTLPLGELLPVLVLPLLLATAPGSSDRSLEHQQRNTAHTQPILDDSSKNCMTVALHRRQCQEQLDVAAAYAPTGSFANCSWHGNLKECRKVSLLSAPAAACCVCGAQKQLPCCVCLLPLTAIVISLPHAVACSTETKSP